MPLQDPSTEIASFRPITAENAIRLGQGFATIDPWARYRYTPEALSTFLSMREEQAPRFEILSEGAIAGALCIRENWLRGPYLQFLGILPEFQNLGLGRAALAFFEDRARLQAARNIWVVASEFNHAALAFYERFGFVRVATLDGLAAEGIGEILLRKRLIIG